MTLDAQSAPSSAGDDTLSMITDLRGGGEVESASTGTETVSEVSTVTETNETTEKAEAAPEDLEKQAEERRNALLREIAIDPELTGQYVQQQYQQPQAPQQAQQEQAAQGNALPFDEYSYDPNNPAHVQAILDARLNEVGGPMFEAIHRIDQRYQQEEAAKQQAQQEQALVQNNKKITEVIDTYVNGFSGVVDRIEKGEKVTAVERAVFNEAVNAESILFNMYASQLSQQYQVPFNNAYSFAQNNMQVRAQIAQQIGPAIKEYAKELGLVAQPSAKTQLSPEQQKQMKQEMYVESSNAVPAANAGTFDKAHEAGDPLQMIRALRGK